MDHAFAVLADAIAAAVTSTVPRTTSYRAAIAAAAADAIAAAAADPALAVDLANALTLDED